jgi:hypothetical protein
MYYTQKYCTEQDNKNCANSDEPSNYYIDAIDNKCSCPDCDCKGTIFLKIICEPTAGYFCNICAIDLRFHGIAEEIISQLAITDARLYNESAGEI